MKGYIRIFASVACLSLAALACQAVTGGPPGGNGADDNPPPTDSSLPAGTDVPPPTAPPDSTGGGDVLLQDDFSSSRGTWGTGTNADRSVEYENDSLRLQVFTHNYIVWTTPNNKDYENVHIEVTVDTSATDETTAFGVLCNQQVTGSAYHYFVVTPAGDYAIAKAAVAQTDVFLTNNDQWATSDQITQNASSYRVGADCGNGTLTLYLDGEEIATISDSTYTSGGVGVIVWSGEDASADVTFDDFVVTSLK